MEGSMNRCQRRLLKVFLESGGDVADVTGIDAFTTVVQSHVMLLSPAVRRAVSMVLDAGEEASYEDIADTLSREEGRPVSVTSVRARVSRGIRGIENAIRRRAGRVAHADLPVVPPAGGPSLNGHSRPRSRQAAPLDDRGVWAVPPRTAYV
jgi:hypothetical protein